MIRSLKPRKPKIARPPIMRNAGLRKKVWDRDAGHCHQCGRFDPRWEMDHEIPLHLGGADTLENARTKCRPCHRQKSNKEMTAKAKTDRLAARHALTLQRRQIT